MSEQSTPLQDLQSLVLFACAQAASSVQVLYAKSLSQTWDSFSRKLAASQANVRKQKLCLVNNTLHKTAARLSTSPT